MIFFHAMYRHFSSNILLSLQHHCVHPSGKPRALRLQTLKSTVSSSLSYSKEECSTSSFFSKTENGTPAKSITSVSTTTPLHPACPPSSPLAPVVRSRRPQQEVLKPVLLVLPPVHFPASFPPRHSRTGFSPSLSFKRWKIPAQTVSHGQFKDAMDKWRPLF